MVTCKDFLRELNEYLDETTDPVIRAELERHINDCPNCWVVCDTTRKTIQVYKGMDAQPISETVHAKLMEAIQKKALESGHSGCGGGTPSL